MKRIAIIPARSGSKGIKDKNITTLLGKPLIAYTIESALQSGMFDKVFVSTDSPLYADISMKYGADASFLRSKKNSTDTAGSWDAVREVILHFEERGTFYDEVMLLQPTSPLRSSDDVKKAVQMMTEKQAESVVSVTETDHSPLWCDILPEDCSMDHFAENEYSELPRQMLPKYYRQNGAIYLVTRKELDRNPMFRSKAYGYIMPKERSVDIDDKLDFLVAETILRNQ